MNCPFCSITSDKRAQSQCSCQESRTITLYCPFCETSQKFSEKEGKLGCWSCHYIFSSTSDYVAFNDDRCHYEFTDRIDGTRFNQMQKKRVLPTRKVNKESNTQR